MMMISRYLLREFSKYIKDYKKRVKDQFKDHNTTVSVKDKELFHNDSELLQRFHDLRKNRKFVGSLQMECHIVVNRLKNGVYELILNEASSLSTDFIKKWDDEEQTTSNLEPVVTSDQDISTNIVSPAMFIFSEGNCDISDSSQRKHTNKYGSNSSKRYVHLIRQKKSKVKSLIDTIKETNPKYDNEDLIALFSDAINHLDPPKKRKRINMPLQQQVDDLNLPPITKKLRKTWKPSLKQYVIDRMELIAANVDIKVKQAVIDSLGGSFVGLKWSEVKQWIASNEKEKKRSGPKVNEEFENAVWSRLLITIKTQAFDVDQNKMLNQVKVLQNITYSYDIIKGSTMVL